MYVQFTFTETNDNVQTNPYCCKNMLIGQKQLQWNPFIGHLTSESNMANYNNTDILFEPKRDLNL